MVSGKIYSKKVLKMKVMTVVVVTDRCVPGGAGSRGVLWRSARLLLKAVPYFMDKATRHMLCLVKTTCWAAASRLHVFISSWLRGSYSYRDACACAIRDHRTTRDQRDNLKPPPHKLTYKARIN